MIVTLLHAVYVGHSLGFRPELVFVMHTTWVSADKPLHNISLLSSINHAFVCLVSSIAFKILPLCALPDVPIIPDRGENTHLKLNPCSPPSNDLQQCEHHHTPVSCLYCVCVCERYEYVMSFKNRPFRQRPIRAHVVYAWGLGAGSSEI